MNGRMSLAEEWRQLRHTVGRVEADIAQSPSIQPTKLMVDLLILGEDHRFYWHPGVDPFALLRALWKTLRGIRQGGSTIAMQLVRTLTGNYERTCSRKLRELVLAIMITSWKGRNAVPILYLWVAYYGWRMNGMRQVYTRLRLDAPRGSPLDAAKLVAQLKYPEPRLRTQKRVAQIDLRARYLKSLMGTEQNGKFVMGPRWNRSRFLRHS
jgi:membrane carboxypeptidase/penicillin-binding protein PbpC